MQDLLTQSTAKFSPCRRYRYSLVRRWGRGACIGFILLNPSTADEYKNDPTVERLYRRALQTGFDAFLVLNAYGFRATEPERLWEVDDPVGPDNDAVIAANLPTCEMLVCGWGHHAKAERVAQLRPLLAAYGGPVTALHVNADGSPAHPLYIPYERRPVPFVP